jgi:hypothetical protein
MTDSSSSKPRSGRKRLYREVLRVAVILLLLEIVVRVEPFKSLLADALDPYENLLWYSENMPAYQDQLTNGPHYDVWLGGSSYMMTGLQPEWIGETVRESGIEGLSFQNYGLNTMQNLGDMADIYDRWLFQMDQPDYMILAISFFNFTPGGRLPSRARTSPMEQATIFSDSIDDYAAGWLYRNSALYHYTLLARNATFIPRARALLQPMPLGGFVEANDPFGGCDPNRWANANTQPDLTMITEYSSLDRFLNVIQARGIAVAIVNIPMQYCSMRNSFVSFADYRARYLTPVSDHLRSLGILFLDMDSPFQAQIAEDEQHLYFRDFNHPNSKGARLFSQWTGEFAATWIKSLDAPPAG